jgi:putative flippase GtrA
VKENAGTTLKRPCCPVPDSSKTRLGDSVTGQFAGFAIIGALNTIMTFLLYQLIIFVAPYWLAYSLSFLVGLAFSLVMNARMVFNRAITAGLAGKYVAFYAASFLAGLGIVAGLIDWFSVPPRLAPIGSVATLVLINFFGIRILLGRGRITVSVVQHPPSG